MKYDDPTDGTHINLEAGLQQLDGKNTLDYVRHRLDNRGSKYYSSDFDRGQRQQVVIKAMVDKMKSFTGISSIFTVLNVAGDHAKTDLSKDQIKGLVLDFKSVGSENIASLDTGGFWDRASSHTIIPKENLQQIQLAFQREMGIQGVNFESSLRVDGGASKSNTAERKTETKTAPKNQAQEAPVKKQAKEEHQEETKPPTKAPPAAKEPVGQPVQVEEKPATVPVVEPQPKPEPTPVPNPPEQSGMLQPPSQPVVPQPTADTQG